VNTPLVVVVGDALLDVDVIGRATRLAPDAAVPVIDDARESARPGGAALAAALLALDGVDVALVTSLGDDESSTRLRNALPRRIELIAIPLHGELPRKVRIRAGSQTLARLDHGGGRPQRVGDDGLRDAFRRASAVLVSDYGRGLTTLLRDDIADVAKRVPVVWDPHPLGARPVAGVATVTPNAAEAAGFLNQAPASGVSLGQAGLYARELLGRWRSRSVCVTRGQDGALLSYGDENPLVVPAPKVHCVDACGAGDRFAGAFTAALAHGALPSEAVVRAVFAASSFVEIGVGNVFTARDRPSSSEPYDRIERARKRGSTIVATGGCFDLLHAGHVETLSAARALGDFLVVCLNSDASVTRLKGKGRPLVAAADRARVLEALECVDAVVVFDEDTPAEALTTIRPHIWAKGGDYSGQPLPETAVLTQWGGQVVVLPYLAGRSTTALIAAVGDTASKDTALKGISR
jgi:rfaE bifunctional protein nucleotidyltransferase chain/domain/rfaE bifunctional protein kinase chain/domain